MSYTALLSFIWKFVRSQLWTFAIILMVSFVWSIDATVWPIILQEVIDIFTQYESNRAAAWPALQVPVLYGLLLWILVEVGFRCQGYLLAKALPKLEADMRMAMFEHVQYHSPKYFNENFAGSLANKITDMITNVSTILQLLLTTFIPAFAACILGVIFFARVNTVFAVLLGIWLIAHFAICLLFTRKCDRYENQHGEARTNLIGKIVDSFTNNFAVNLFYRFAQERTFIQTYQNEEKQKNFAAKKYVEKMRLVLGVFMLLGAGFGIQGGMIYFWIHGQLSSGEVAQIFNTTWNLCQIVWIVGFSLPSFFQSVGIAKQAFTIMQDKPDIIDSPDAKPLKVSKGEIVFDDVSFKHGKKRLFQNKHVQIRGGERVGLVGYSGAGKSSFVNLIMRFFPLEKGKILIDGQEISKVTLKSLRSQIALIPQDPILFHRTLKENILYGNPNATEEEMLEAAELAHCSEFISKLPDGYNSMVGERGTKLSGGERQRIAIARAILTKAPILILDEATSALDSVTEKYIQESLEWLMQNRTTIVIAHRLSTLAGMERILVFNEGKIEEQGTHDELLALGGHYSYMWSMQAGGFLPEDTENGENLENPDASEASEAGI